LKDEEDKSVILPLKSLGSSSMNRRLRIFEEITHTISKENNP
jgi:hypothetical protein